MTARKLDTLLDLLCPTCAERIEKATLRGIKVGSRVTDAEIAAALCASGGNKQKAADLLGVHKRTIENRTKGKT